MSDDERKPNLIIGIITLGMAVLLGFSIGSMLTVHRDYADFDAMEAKWMQIGKRWRRVGALEGRAAASNRWARQFEEDTAAIKRLQCAPRSRTGAPI